MSNDKNTPHAFLTVSDLKSFNESVERNVTNDKSGSIPYDPTKFESFIVDPIELDDDVVYQLADIIDKKTQLDKRDLTDKAFVAPNTVERLLASDKIAYVTEDGFPVGVATLIDATKENFMGIIPSDFYALKSAVNLNDRMQQEFFAVTDENKNMGISGELRKRLEEVSPLMFVTAPSSDIDTLEGLTKNGYKHVSDFETDWEATPVQLWIN